MQDLDGKVAVVTGASRGIGRGCAEALAEAGAKVIAIARSAEELAEVASHESGLIEAMQGDVTSEETALAIERIENLSILVNNAGANRPQPVAEVDAESLDLVIGLNVRASFRIAQAAVRAMQAAGQGGSIVNMSSQMGHIGSPNRSVYCMTKHAVEGLTKAMAVELAPDNIRVNTVAPTFIETALTAPMLKDPKFMDFVLDMIPMRKVGNVADVVAAVMYLVSPGARLVTGTSLKVDGGWTAR
ncbi:MAG: SDR family oxidoreductase [Pseudomonadota bacterium]